MDIPNFLLSFSQLMNIWVVFTFWLLTNNASMYVCLQVFYVNICFHFSWILGIELMGHTVTLNFNTLKNYQSAFKSVHFTFLPAMYEGSNFSTCSPILSIGFLVLATLMGIK